MKYLEKSFTLPASQGITQEAWDKIWAQDIADRLTPPEGPEARTTGEDVLEFIRRNTPPATESENPVTDTVANGSDSEYMRSMELPRCPNCHCGTNSYRHIETCVTPGEE